MIAYVIGDSDMITGFKLVGVEGVEATSTVEVKEALHKAVTRDDIAVIIISEDFLNDQSVRDEVDKLRQERVTPSIVAIPGSKGQSTQPQLSEIISKILGIKI
jgi:V/A-type H+-transporting ATPase subunit F